MESTAAVKTLALMERWTPEENEEMNPQYAI